MRFLAVFALFMLFFGSFALPARADSTASQALGMGLVATWDASQTYGLLQAPGTREEVFLARPFVHSIPGVIAWGGLAALNVELLRHASTARNAYFEARMGSEGLAIVHNYRFAASIGVKVW